MTVSDTSERANKSVWWRVGVGIVGALLLYLGIAFWRPPNRHIPEELQGEWHTTDANYSDRTFEMDPVCITFTTGEGNISVGFIQDVKALPDGSRMLYTVSYTVDGVPNVVSFYYDQNNDKRLWFKNQDKVIWKKDANS